MNERHDLPRNFREYKEMYTEMFNAFQNGSSLARATGPLDIKTTHLIQMAAAIGAHSEGAVHSHARRALEAGASHEELYQTVNLMISTLGFPAAAAAFSWINDIIKKD